MENNTTRNDTRTGLSLEAHETKEGIIDNLKCLINKFDYVDYKISETKDKLQIVIFNINHDITELKISVEKNDYPDIYYGQLQKWVYHLRPAIFNLSIS